jgi:hypothetical protein
LAIILAFFLPLDRVGFTPLDIPLGKGKKIALARVAINYFGEPWGVAHYFQKKKPRRLNAGSLARSVKRRFWRLLN